MTSVPVILTVVFVPAVALIGLIVLFVIIRRERRDSRAEGEHEHEFLLVSPNWDIVEQEYRLEVPAAVKVRLYAPEHSLRRGVVLEGLTDNLEVVAFNPVGLGWSEPRGDTRFYFAREVGGEEFYVDLSLDDSPVWLASRDVHDSSGGRLVSRNVSEFLAMFPRLRSKH